MSVRWVVAGRRIAGMSIGAWAFLARTLPVLAASPAPSQDAIGDPRAGQAAGFAGDPGTAIALVVLIAIVAVVATLVWVRVTGGPAAATETPADTDAFGDR